MIPIVINNRNRLTTTRKLVEDLKRLGQLNIWIIDNSSTYPPLLEWYNTNPCTILYEDNLGPYAIYHIPLFRTVNQVIYTDSDIELNPNMPDNFVEIFEQLSWTYKGIKVGTGLRVDDLPPYPQSENYKNWEAQNWIDQVQPYIYKGYIDTTFALINPNIPFSYEGIRICSPNIIARHIPWYLKLEDLDEENIYYIEHANDYSTLKRFYNSDIKQNN